jgi:hypothetical protein
LRSLAIGKPAAATADLAMRIASEVIEQTQARSAALQSAAQSARSAPPAAAPAASTPEPLSDDAITKLVDRFLAERNSSARQPRAAASPAPFEAQKPAAMPETKEASEPAKPAAPAAAPESNNVSTNGHRPLDFVCEDDVKRALRDKQKIYVNAKTIITPAARELGEENEIFAKS